MSKAAVSAALPSQVTLANAGRTLVELKQALSLQTGPVVMLDAASLSVFDSSAVAVLLEGHSDSDDEIPG